MTSRSILAGLLISAIGVSISAQAALNVWVDFNASWSTELDDAATGAGAPAFSVAEEATIEANILTELNRIYNDYQITFVTSNPGGSYDWIDMGSTGGGGGVLGDSPLFFAARAYHTDGGSKVNMYAQEFAFIIESGSPRATQITELSVAIAGTAAHELGHSLGLHHHHAYGNAGITPANYANTAGIQNTAIIASGSTGLTEAGRESLRVLGRWERALLDITGGSLFGGPTVVNFPVATELESADAGATAATSQALIPQTGETSGLTMGFVTGDLDGSGADVDWYNMTITTPGTLTLDLWSANVYGDSFNTRIRLIDLDGSTVLYTNTDSLYGGNVYGSGGSGTTDSFLPNYVITTPGTYYFAVDATAGGAVGDDYSLIIGFDSSVVPEPSVILLGLVGGFALYWKRHQRA